jgi:hypothetical protein
MASYRYCRDLECEMKRDAITSSESHCGLHVSDCVVVTHAQPPAAHLVPQRTASRDTLHSRTAALLASPLLDAQDFRRRSPRLHL